MKTIDLLRQRAPTLARQIDGAGDLQLRKLTLAVVRASIERTRLANPIIIQAISRLNASERIDSELRDRVRAIAERLDEKYFALKEPLEEREDGGKTDPEVTLAFSRARAATAVAYALGEDARAAAASATYEAIFATDDVDYLTNKVEKALLT